MIFNIPEETIEELEINHEGLWKFLMKYKESSSGRYISRLMRYNILRRQNWSCNECGIKLKYGKKSAFIGDVAHIDHIHPYSKKETYTGEDINEPSNLQALCSTCNLKKGKKEIN